MKCAGIAVFIVFCFGCGKNTPPSGAVSAPLATAATTANAGESVTVGDPTHTPGHFGGPCENEDCGHEKCNASRKFISDAHPCVVCGKPIVWGDQIVVFFVDGKSSNAAGGDGVMRIDPDNNWKARLNGIDLISHEKCREVTNCAICNWPLAVRNEIFHLRDDKLCHDRCYDNRQKQQQASPTD
jgi:hypothetical protein